MNIIGSLKMEEECRNHRISTTHGMSGFFAVHIAEFSDDGKLWYTDVINTGTGRYKNSEDARKEAKQWSVADEIPLER